MYVWGIFFEVTPGRWILLKLFSTKEKAIYALDHDPKFDPEFCAIEKWFVN